MAENQSTIRWLHISDLHILLRSPEWSNYEGRFFGFFERNPDKKPQFVVITGDYRNIRKKEPFDYARDFIQKLKCQMGFSEHDIFMVPGNHDMEPKNEHGDSRGEQLIKLLPAGLLPWEKKDDSEINDWLSKCESEPADYLDRLCGERRTDEENKDAIVMEPLLKGFDYYQQMVCELIPWYNEVGWEPAKPHRRTWKRLDEDVFNIVHLNTALVADGSRCHYQALDLLEAQKSFKLCDKKLPTLILAHNSFDDLHPQIKRKLVMAMSEARVCAWLCGDVHTFSGDNFITCPVDGGAYSIPIFACGKGAPDHGDRYSENGFMLYEVDGKNLTPYRCIWDPDRGLKLESLGSKAIASPDVIDVPPKKTKKIRIGYLSCDPSTKPECKYHLGHAYFIHLMDEWCKDSNVMILTSSYIFKPNRSTYSMRLEADYAEELVNRWDDCFGRQVKVIDIKQYLQEDNPFDEKEKELLLYISQMEMMLDKNREWMNFIENWSKTGDISDVAYRPIMEIMGISGSTVIYTKDEVMSFAYLLYKRPTWYSGPWLINFLHFWNAQLYPLIRNNFDMEVDPEEVFIVEARRNHYVWDAISYCAKRFGYMKFPEVQYFENLMGKDCRTPMKSSDKENVVLLADRDNDENYSDWFVKHLHERFASEESPSELKSEYRRRLGLN